MTNRERLEEAGILDPNRNLTAGQYDAIEDLYEWEVDRLISIKDKLEDLSENAAGGPIQPGINPVNPLEQN